MTTLLRILKSVSNARRLKILELLLKKGMLSLSEISNLTKIPKPSTCRHLKTLEATLMIKSQIKNGKTYYSLNPKRPLRFNRNITNLLKKQRKRYLY